MRMGCTLRRKNFGRLFLIKINDNGNENEMYKGFDLNKAHANTTARKRYTISSFKWLNKDDDYFALMSLMVI